MSAVSDKSLNLVVVPGQPSASVSVARPQLWVSVFTAPYMYVGRYIYIPCFEVEYHEIVPP